MRRIVFLSTLAFLLTTGPAVAASSSVRLEIVHTFRGCHIWSRESDIGPSARITIRHGTKLTIRVSCPMDFDLSQASGQPLKLGRRRLYAGTVTTIVFQRRGLYKLLAKNVESSVDAGLQTLGDDNTLSLSVRVT